MKIKISIIIIIFLSFFLAGCVQSSEKTPTPTGSPTAVITAAEIVEPTVIPATSTPFQIPSTEAIKYIVWIDSDYGFYRARAVSGNHTVNLPSEFDILDFTIRVGDKVKWMNDDSYDFPLTIVSNEGLWGDRIGYMRYQGERFEYHFNRTGNYTFSIKEYPRIKPQKLSVIQ